jgi:hypothetical protein
MQRRTGFRIRGRAEVDRRVHALSIAIAFDPVDDTPIAAIDGQPVPVAMNMMSPTHAWFNRQPSMRMRSINDARQQRCGVYDGWVRTILSRTENRRHQSFNFLHRSISKPASAACVKQSNMGAA